MWAALKIADRAARARGQLLQLFDGVVVEASGCRLLCNKRRGTTSRSQAEGLLRTGPRAHLTSRVLASSSYSIMNPRALSASAQGRESVTATANAYVGRLAPSKRSSAAMLLPLWTLSSTRTIVVDLGIAVEVRVKAARISSALLRTPLVFATTVLRWTASTSTVPRPTPASARQRRSVGNRADSMVDAVTSDDGTGTSVIARGSSAPKNFVSLAIRFASMAVTYSSAL